MEPSSITKFFSTSLKKDNGPTNKTRELILSNIKNIPIEYFQDPEYGHLWNKLYTEWSSQITIISEGISYTSYNIKHKGGQKNNHDFIVSFYNDTILTKQEKIEFKYGASSIKHLPQILSVSATDYPLSSISYTEYYYDNCLDKYIACDKMITEPKPSKNIYLREIFNFNKVTHPFFIQIKNRNKYNQIIKYNIARDSIKRYLEHYAPLIHIPTFYEKINPHKTKKYL